MFGLNWLLGAGLKALGNFLARIFKDWRRDEGLKEQGRLEERNAAFEEGEVRRKDADQIRREAEGADVIVKDDEL